MVRIICDYCGQSKCISSKSFKLYKLHFCNRDCYINYRRKHPKEFVVAGPQSGTAQRKLTRLALLRKELCEQNAITAADS